MKDTGGPAFPGFQFIPGYGCSRPVTAPNGDVHFEEHAPGMTLRDWYAGMALPSVVAMIEAQDLTRKTPERVARVVAFSSYMIADAMLAERNK